MYNSEDIEILAEQFTKCKHIFTALGDESRQYLILEMMKMGKCGGVRVGELAEQVNLSRPAISHHLQILKQAGIIKMRKCGTKNYYHFNPEMQSFKTLIDVLERSIKIASEIHEEK